MPLHPMLWHLQPHLRRLPTEIADQYFDGEMNLAEVCELWEWMHDLARPGPPMGAPVTDRDRVAARLGSEVDEFLRMQELYKAEDELGRSETGESES